MQLIAGTFTLALLTVSVGAQTVRLGDVVSRVDDYLQRYEERLANVVAEERETISPRASSRSSTSKQVKCSGRF